MNFKIGYFLSGSPSFDEIYSDIRASYGGTFGVGYKGKFLFVKFRQFDAFGKSKLSNLEVPGKATWHQEFAVVGVRFYSERRDDISGYIDVGGVFTQIDEEISTSDPFIPELFGFAQINNWGVTGAMGLDLWITHFIALNVELEYSRILFDTNKGLDKEKINLGGVYFGTGITITLY